MRIKNLEIGDFGKLRDINIALDEKITVISGKNEAGKSSIASYIKYMLYGFSTSRSSDVSENAKKKYIPWDSDECSGGMSFVTDDGKEFSVMRRTAVKSGCTVFDNNGTPVTSDNPGEYFLGMSESGYKKTAFIGQSDVIFNDEGELDEAIKNMVYSADESVDSQKALKKLETLRKYYLGKAGRSGEIFEIDKLLNELHEQRDKWQGGHKELLSAEYQLSELTENIASKKEKKALLDKEILNLQYYKAKQSLEEIEKCKARLYDTKAKLEEKYGEISYDGFVPDEEFLSLLKEKLGEIKHASESLKDAKQSQQQAKDGLESLYSDGVQARINTVLSEMNATSKEVSERLDGLVEEKAKYKRMAIVCFVLFFLVVPLFFAIKFLGKSKKANEKIQEILESFGGLSLEELKAALNKDGAMKDVFQSAKTVFETAAEKVKKSKQTLDDMVEQLRELVKKAGISDEDVKSLVSKAAEYGKYLEEKLLYIDTLKKKCNDEFVAYKTLTASSEVEKLTEDVAKYDKSIPLRDETKIKQEYAFYTQSIEALEKRERELEKNVAVLTGTLPKPAEIQSKILSLTELREDYEEKRKALDMAMETLEKASENMRSTTAPKIASETSRLFNSITQGKYKALYTDSKMNLTFLEQNGVEIREGGYLSTGTLDAAYICLRIALCRFLYKEKPVLIFDDAFTHMDDERLKTTLDFIVELSEEFQIVILSCHTREAQYLENMGKCIDFAL